MPDIPTFAIVSSYLLQSPFLPTGDQPQAIDSLSRGVEAGTPAQTLLGVTGSGKTFTIANVIQRACRPTLIISHNKTLAAQLYSEMKGFFPSNAVEYYVSYYDYYQPEAYIPATDTYIEKDLQINQEIDRLRLRALSSLLSGRRDVVIVASVSCIYGMGNPAAFYEQLLTLRVGDTLPRNQLLRRLADLQYVRDDSRLEGGRFRVVGDTVDIALAYSPTLLHIEFWGEQIEALSEIPLPSDTPQPTSPTGRGREGGPHSYDLFHVYPANLFLTSPGAAQTALEAIEKDLHVEESELRLSGRLLEADRLHERVKYDLEMIRELGHCSGIENYSRYFDGRPPGTRPYCLIDFFPKDFLCIIDESHVTIPQLRAMYHGDRSRKEALIQYGFRLRAALDNRPLKFSEFEQLTPQTIYVSATPAEYELERSQGVVVEQVVRPTGLLDPPISVRPSLSQIDDLLHEILQCVDRDERVLVTTLTKRMAEDLTDYLLRQNIRAAYIHSDVDTLERVQILDSLRLGQISVLVGINLLREGLDLPEVALVAILDADKEGFLRTHRSMIQTAGRAARNINGRVIMYAARITASMQQTIDETNRRRAKQQAYNQANNITPRQILRPRRADDLSTPTLPTTAAEAETDYNSTLPQGVSFEGETIESLRRKMQMAARGYDFILAAQYRDAIRLLEKTDGTT